MSTRERERVFSQTDEIDVIAVFSSLLQFISRHKLKLILFPLVGLVLAYFIYLRTTRSYDISMLANSKILTGEEVANIIASWHSLIVNGESNLLASQLGVSSGVVDEIRKIEATANIGSDKGTFVLKATVTDNSIIDSLQKGIVYGLANNAYATERSSFRKRQLNELKQKSQQEIQQLDSVKYALQKLITVGSNRTASPFLADPGNINVRRMELYEKLLETNEQLQFIEHIQIIQNFNKVNEPNNPKRMPYLSLGIVTGFLLALFFALIQQAREYGRG